jgi:ribosomal protein S18 acetylase RimI-like enzyme
VSEIELRAPRLDETEALADLINRDSGELYGEQEETPESIALWLTGPGLDPETDMRVAVAEGRLCGYVDIEAHPDPTYWVDLRVPPSENSEIRGSLLDWAEQQARERGAGKPDALVRFYAASVDRPTKDELEARGYLLIRHSYRMRIDFDAESGRSEPQWPSGVAIRPGTLADAQLAYDVQNETFKDVWEFDPYPFDEWSHWMTDYDEFDPSLWFVAEAGSEVAGISLCRMHEAEEGLGWVRVLGVRRPWRRQGLGRALLLHTFQEFRRRGATAVGLGVDAESLTGANRLYETAGMRVVRRHDIYEKGA